MASYYSYESGTQFLVIDLTAIVALQRSGNEFLIHTTGGIIKATQHMYEELLPIWRAAVIKTQMVRKGSSSSSSPSSFAA
jgi:hypothetical protein